MTIPSSLILSSCILSLVASYPGSVPSCSVPHPIGHSILDSSSQSFSNPKALPVKFNVIEGDNSFRIIMEGDFIKGYLIRSGQDGDRGSSGGNFLLDLLHVTNDFLKSLNRRLQSAFKDVPAEVSSTTWSVPESFAPGFPWTTIQEGCVHHNLNFSRGRDPSDKTYMEFEYRSSSRNPTFEAIIVEKFDTWWHKILISKDSEGVYQTQFNI